MPWNTYPRISDYELYNFSGYKRLKNADAYLVDTLRHFHGDVIGYPYSNSYDGFGNDLYNHYMRPYYRRYRSPSPNWRSEKSASIRTNYGAANRSKTKFPEKRNFYSRNRRLENGSHQENSVHSFDDQSVEFKRYDSETDRPGSRIEQRYTSPVFSTNGYQRFSRRSRSDITQEKYDYGGKASNKDANKVGNNLSQNYLFRNGSLTSIGLNEMAYAGSHTADGNTNSKSLTSISGDAENHGLEKETISATRSSSSGMTVKSSSPTEADDCSSWYLPEEQEQIVEMLREVDLRHERQLVHDILVIKGEISRSDDSFNSSCDACFGDVGHQRSMSSEEEDDGVIILLPIPRASHAMPQDIPDLEPSPVPVSGEVNVDLLNYFSGKLLERARNDYFNDATYPPFRDSPDKLIPSLVTKSNERPTVSLEDKRGDSRKSPIEIMSEDLKKLIGIKNLGHGIKVVDSEVNSPSKMVDGFSPRAQSTPKSNAELVGNYIGSESRSGIAVKTGASDVNPTYPADQKDLSFNGNVTQENDGKTKVKNRMAEAGSFLESAKGTSMEWWREEAGQISRNIFKSPASKVEHDRSKTKRSPGEKPYKILETEKIRHGDETNKSHNNTKLLDERNSSRYSHANKSISILKEDNAHYSEKEDLIEAKCLESPACLRRKTCKLIAVDLEQKNCVKTHAPQVLSESITKTITTNDQNHSLEYKRISVDELFMETLDKERTVKRICSSFPTSCQLANGLPQGEFLIKKQEAKPPRRKLSDDESLKRLLNIGNHVEVGSSSPSKITASEHLKQILGIKPVSDILTSAAYSSNTVDRIIERKKENSPPLYTWKYSPTIGLPKKINGRYDTVTPTSVSPFSGSISLPSVNYESSLDESPKMQHKITDVKMCPKTVQDKQISETATTAKGQDINSLKMNKDSKYQGEIRGTKPAAAGRKFIDKNKPEMHDNLPRQRYYNQNSSGKVADTSEHASTKVDRVGNQSSNFVKDRATFAFSKDTKSKAMSDKIVEKSEISEVKDSSLSQNQTGTKKKKKKKPKKKNKKLSESLQENKTELPHDECKHNSSGLNLKGNFKNDYSRPGAEKCQVAEKQNAEEKVNTKSYKSWRSRQYQNMTNKYENSKGENLLETYKTQSSKNKNIENKDGITKQFTDKTPDANRPENKLVKNDSQRSSYNQGKFYVKTHLSESRNKSPETSRQETKQAKNDSHRSYFNQEKFSAKTYGGELRNKSSETIRHETKLAKYDSQRSSYNQDKLSAKIHGSEFRNKSPETRRLETKLSDKETQRSSHNQDKSSFKNHEKEYRYKSPEACRQETKLPERFTGKTHGSEFRNKSPETKRQETKLSDKDSQRSSCTQDKSSVKTHEREFRNKSPETCRQETKLPEKFIEKTHGNESRNKLLWRESQTKLYKTKDENEYFRYDSYKQNKTTKENKKCYPYHAPSFKDNATARYHQGKTSVRLWLPPEEPKTVDVTEYQKNIVKKNTDQFRASNSSNNFNLEKRKRTEKDRPKCYSSCELMSPEKRTVEMGVCPCNRKHYRRTGLELNLKQEKMDNFLRQEGHAVINKISEKNYYTCRGNKSVTKCRNYEFRKTGETSDGSSLVRTVKDTLAIEAISSIALAKSNITPAVQLSLTVPRIHVNGNFNSVSPFVRMDTNAKKINKLLSFNPVGYLNLMSPSLNAAQQLILHPMAGQEHLLNRLNFRRYNFRDTYSENVTSSIFFNTLKDYTMQRNIKRKFWSGLVENAYAVQPWVPRNSLTIEPRRKISEIKKVKYVREKKAEKEVENSSTPNIPCVKLAESTREKVLNDDIDRVIDSFITELENIYGDEWLSNRQECSK